MRKYEELPDLLTVAEVCEFLKISSNTAYELLRCKEIPSVRIGRSIRIPKKALVRMLEGTEV